MAAMTQTDVGRFANILAICQRINSERDLGSLLDLIAREATKLLDCDRASICASAAAACGGVTRSY